MWYLNNVYFFLHIVLKKNLTLPDRNPPIFSLDPPQIPQFFQTTLPSESSEVKILRFISEFLEMSQQKFGKILCGSRKYPYTPHGRS